MPEKLWVMELTQAQAADLERIRAELATLGPCLPGSVVVRLGRCGKSYCSCRSDPPRLHGPYRSWTRKVAGKTVTRLLSEAQHKEYQALFDNAKRLRSLLSELEMLGLELIDAEESPTPADIPPRSTVAG
jgi:hypothetical protein